MAGAQAKSRNNGKLKIVKGYTCWYFNKWKIFERINMIMVVSIVPQIIPNQNNDLISFRFRKITINNNRPSGNAK